MEFFLRTERNNQINYLKRKQSLVGCSQDTKIFNCVATQAKTMYQQGSVSQGLTVQYLLFPLAKSSNRFRSASMLTSNWEGLAVFSMDRAAAQLAKPKTKTAKNTLFMIVD